MSTNLPSVDDRRMYGTGDPNIMQMQSPGSARAGASPTCPLLESKGLLSRWNVMACLYRIASWSDPNSPIDLILSYCERIELEARRLVFPVNCWSVHGILMLASRACSGPLSNVACLQKASTAWISLVASFQLHVRPSSGLQTEPRPVMMPTLTPDRPIG